jgi:hypothetical protein
MSVSGSGDSAEDFGRGGRIEFTHNGRLITQKVNLTKRVGWFGREVITDKSAKDSIFEAAAKALSAKTHKTFTAEEVKFLLRIRQDVKRSVAVPKTLFQKALHYTKVQSAHKATIDLSNTVIRLTDIYEQMCAARIADIASSGEPKDLTTFLHEIKSGDGEAKAIQSQLKRHLESKGTNPKEAEHLTGKILSLASHVDESKLARRLLRKATDLIHEESRRDNKESVADEKLPKALFHLKRLKGIATFAKDTLPELLEAREGEEKKLKYMQGALREKL